MVSSATNSATRNRNSANTRMALFDAREACSAGRNCMTLIVEFAAADVVRIFRGPARLLSDQVARRPRIDLGREARHRVDQQERDENADSNGGGVNVRCSFSGDFHLAPR